jgi:hypothetical protein
MYESGEIHAGFMFTSNPYITWAVKLGSMYESNPNQKFTIATTYPSLLIDNGLVSEVNKS